MTDVAAGLFRKEGRYLVAKRSRGNSNPGEWEFPGGKIQPGESPEEALHREICEEFGVECSVGDLFAVACRDYAGLSVRLWVFRGTLPDTDLRLVDHDEALWLYPEEMSGLRFSEADQPVVTLLRSGVQ